MISILSLPFQFVSAFFKILADRRLLIWCLIPYLIGFFVFAGSLFAAYEYRQIISDYLLAWINLERSTWLSWVIFVLNIFLSAMASVAAMLILGGFFIENFIEAALKKSGLESESSRGIGAYTASIIRGVRDGLLRLVIYGTIAILALISSFVPPLSLFFAVVGIFIMGIDLFELPLSLTGRKFGERMNIIFSHKLEVLAVGLFFSLFLLIPFGGVVFLPLAYLVAIERIAKWPLQVR